MLFTGRILDDVEGVYRQRRLQEKFLIFFFHRSVNYNELSILAMSVASTDTCLRHASRVLKLAP